MNEQEWKEARKKGIGGTDIAAIYGLNRWKSPMDVYLDKIGAGSERESNDAMYWGTAMERVIAERFSEDHPEFVLERNSDNELMMHPEYPFIVGSFDGVVWNTGDVPAFYGQPDPGATPIAGWECKTASAYKKKEWEGSDVPQEYWLQCQWYMAISGLPKWYLSVLIGCNDYREWLIERDDEAIEMLIRRAVEFWELVETRTPPPIDGTPASTDTLNRLYPAEEAVLDPPLVLPDAEALAAQYLAARAALAEAKTTVDTLENELKALMGSHAVAVTPSGYEVDWKPRQRVSYDTKRMAEEVPQIAEAYKKVTEYRVFSVKEPRGDES